MELYLSSSFLINAGYFSFIWLSCIEFSECNLYQERISHNSNKDCSFLQFVHFLDHHKFSLSFSKAVGSLETMRNRMFELWNCYLPLVIHCEENLMSYFDAVDYTELQDVRFSSYLSTNLPLKVILYCSVSIK